MNKLIVSLALSLFFVSPTVGLTISVPDYILSAVMEKSAEYNISYIIPLMIIKEESRFNPLAINYNDGRKGCHSRGLVQINDCYHDISKKDAYDVDFSIDFLVKNLAQDHCQWMWSTCPIGKGVKLSTTTLPVE